ncbi:MAG: ROK family protein [Oscillospiraceae bacterium]|nr:ROK family protein [Oscillospiraceae bacterium]
MYRIGIDLGGTNIAVGVVDAQKQIVGRGLRKTNSPRPYEQVFADIVAAAEDAIVNAGITLGDVASIGLGTPGSIDKRSGMITYANNLEFHDVPAVETLRGHFGKPVFLDNDANAAALGECCAGAGRDENVDSFVMITLGTGVGSGIIIDGKILRGINYAAGEMGHMVIIKDGSRCTCGRRGCWESYSSARALVQQTRDIMRANQDSLMWQLCDDSYDNISGQTAFRAAERGDEPGKLVVKNYIAFLAAGIVNIINIFQPAMVCIGGGIGKEGETLLEPLRHAVVRERYSRGADRQTELVTAVLGNDAGILGAALLED